MSSSLSWLDRSEAERDRIRTALALLGETDTRDELGIGTIRDAFADLFFPGINVVQRRARYFLFIPWMYVELEHRQVSSTDIAARARRDEVGLIDLLAASDDHDGVIGIEARKTLKRLPSSVYWRGLGIWGIRPFHGTQDEYHRSLDRHYLQCRQARRNDDGESVEALRRNWDPRLPPAPEGLGKAETSLRLRPSEAMYLQGRILDRTHPSLLAVLAARVRPWEKVPYAWAHPDYGTFPIPVREALDHARNFAESIQGAALLYNLMLAEASHNVERIEHYRYELGLWADEVTARGAALAAWDEGQFWRATSSGGARIPIATRSFVSRWLVLVRPAGASARLADSAEARALLSERERRLKGNQARLHNPRALERWSGAAGTLRLDFRWERAQVILLDILEQLAQGTGDA